MAKVFVVQNRYITDPVSGNVRPYYNMNAMAEWGEIVELLDWRLSPMVGSPANAILRSKLQGIAPEDYLVGIGAPAFIMAAAAIAAEFNGGKLNILHWDKTSGRYYPVRYSTHSVKEAV